MIQRIFKVTLILILLCSAVYIRMIYLQSENYPTLAHQLASKHIQSEIRRQIENRLEPIGQSFQGAEREAFIEQKVSEIITQDQAEYQRTVDIAAGSILATLKQNIGRHYLLESDPYYYYHLVKRIELTGKISDVIKSGKFLDRDREWPHGAWAQLTWHPFLGYFWSKMANTLGLSHNLMESLCYYPLGLLVISIVTFFWLSRFLSLNFVSAWFGAFVMAFSPIYIERSAFGWFDTDPYQFIFPMIIMALILSALQSSKVSASRLGLAGLCTGVYSLFWNGWFFILVLLFTAFIIALTVKKITKAHFSCLSLRDIIVYVATSVVSTVFFLSPSGFAESVTRGLVFVQKYALADQDVWPNPFLVVGEAMPITIQKLIFLTGSPFSAAFCAVGAICLIGKILKNQPDANTLIGFVITFYLLGSIYAALHTERFAVLVVLPLAICVGYAVEFILNVSRRCKFLLKLAIYILSAACLLPPTVALGYTSGKHNIPLIMNDTWYESLEFIRDRTPKDSVIDCWWPPGYFLVSLGERKVLIDGGTQQLPQTYWMSKVLMASDEREARGILRMLNASGNEALVFLQNRGIDLQNAVDLIRQIVKVDRSSSDVYIPGSFSADDRDKFLDLIYGKADPLPAYLYLYNDVVDQNLAITLMSNWDFRKARAANKIVQKKEIPKFSFNDFAKRIQLFSREGFLGLDSKLRFSKELLTQLNKPAFSNAFDDYLSQVLSVAGPVWKFIPESIESGRRGSVVLFPNGAEVDLVNKVGMVNISGSDPKQYQPFSVLYIEDGQLLEKLSFGNVADASILIWEEKGLYHAVLGNRGLLTSVLFRAYFLKGVELQTFKPVFEKSDDRTKTRICIFEINWNKA